MKKKLGIAIATIAGAGIFGVGIYHSDAAQADPTLSTDEIRQMVTEQYPGTITEMELEKELNKIVYEVEVESNGKEIDLKLDGNTGEVLKTKEKEIINNENDDDTDDRDDDKNIDPSKAEIDANKAGEIALKEFAGTITDLELDEDDGRLVYEIEVRDGKEEADFDIDATTGEILELDIDTEDDDD